MNIKKLTSKKWSGLLEAYKEFLEIKDNEKIISLNEGNTPLVRAYNLEKICLEQDPDLKELEIFLKVEGANPSGSFKDRGMTMAITKAISNNLRVMICASTGNTSASAAAYTARARSLGFKEAQCLVIIPEGKIALGKLSQALIYGAKVVQIKGNFDQALKIVRQLSESESSIALVNSVNPDRLEGQKTAAFEILEQLAHENFDILSIPVGNAGNISAYWKGFKEYHAQKHFGDLPKIFGFQAAGACPIVKGKIVENPETIATAIRIGNPASWSLALKAIQESNGQIDQVTDQEIIQAYKIVHAEEGVSCEPASAASVAGLIKSCQQKKVPQYSRIVCVLTGHGLKDPQTAINSSNFEPLTCRADSEEVLKIINNLAS